MRGGPFRRRGLHRGGGGGRQARPAASPSGRPIMTRDDGAARCFRWGGGPHSAYRLLSFSCAYGRTSVCEGELHMTDSAANLMAIIFGAGIFLVIVAIGWGRGHKPPI